MPDRKRTASDRIALLISDVDGTLVTKDKVLTPASLRAVAALRRAGIAFTAVSSRPPRGLSALVPMLALDLPYGGFNGGAVVDPADGRVLEQRALPEPVAREALDVLAERGVSAWVFSGTEWLLLDENGAYVEHERRTVGFGPRRVERFAGPMMAGIGKIVGASEDFEHLARCEAELQARLGERASVLLSQRYYLDVTHPEATKGHFLHALSRRLGIAPQAMAAIGDMANDVSMFREAGLSIAMGNAADAVKAQADLVTDSNAEDGFAAAVERYVLPRAPGAA